MNNKKRLSDQVLTNNYIKLDFGKKIKFIRDLLNVKQDQLARLAGISRSYVGNIETRFSKLRNIPYDIVFALWEHFGINPKWLLKNEGLLFLDSEKGLNFIKNKLFLTIQELYFLIMNIQWIYGLFEEIIINSIIEKKLLCFVQNKIPHLDSLIAEGRNEQPRAGLCNRLLSAVQEYIIDNSFSLDEETIHLLNDTLMPWGFYTARAAVMYEKNKYVPISSTFIDLNIHSAQIDKYLELKLDRYHIVSRIAKLMNWGDFFLLHFLGKGFLELKKEELFGLCILCLNTKKDRKVRVLDFEVFNGETEKVVEIKQKNITISFTIEEFECVKAVLKEVIKNRNLYEYLQACYIEQYGFL